MARLTARVALVAVFLTAVAASASAQSIYQSLKSGGMSFATGASSPATERMRITQGGLVGIGTSAPANTLDVSGSSIPTRITSSNNNFVLNLRGNADATGAYLGSNSGALIFANSGGTENMRITSSGNVGIATAAPAATLQVSGSFIVSQTGQTTTPSLYVSATSGKIGVGTATPGTPLNVVGAIASEKTVGGFVASLNWINGNNPAIGYYAANGLIFGTQTTMVGGAFSEKMRLTNAGLLGIATATPTTALEVSGTVSATHFVGDGSGLTGIAGGGSSGDRIVSTSANVVAGYGGYVSLSTGGVSGTSYFNTTGVWVGPGVSTTGIISATTLYSSGDVNFVGTMNDLSDRRAKTDITPLPEDVLARVLKLRPISFRMKSGGGTEFGFIAQEVQPLFPELVKDGPLLSMNYLGLISPIVKAMQQMQAANDNLRAANDALAARLDMLELENKSLRARLDTLAGEFAENRRARR